MKPITVNDLKDQLNTPYPRPLLLCPHCGAENSAHADDYWNLPKDHVFTCCDEPMQLVVKRTSFEDVAP